MSDPQVLGGLMQMPYATEEFWRKRIEDMPAGSAAHELFLVAERDGTLVGNAGLMPVTHVRRRHVMAWAWRWRARPRGRAWAPR